MTARLNDTWPQRYFCGKQKAVSRKQINLRVCCFNTVCMSHFIYIYFFSIEDTFSSLSLLLIAIHANARIVSSIFDMRHLYWDHDVVINFMFKFQRNIEVARVSRVFIYFLKWQYHRSWRSMQIINSNWKAGLKSTTKGRKMKIFFNFQHDFEAYLYLYTRFFK